MNTHIYICKKKRKKNKPWRLNHIFHIKMYVYQFFRVGIMITSEPFLHLLQEKEIIFQNSVDKFEIVLKTCSILGWVKFKTYMQNWLAKCLPTSILLILRKGPKNKTKQNKTKQTKQQRQQQKTTTPTITTTKTLPGLMADFFAEMGFF